MENNDHVEEKISLPASGRSLTRREWVQRMLAGAGAGIATPVLAEAHWADAVNTQAAPAEAAGEWKPAFFDEPQNQLVIALAERIVPGSTGAQVNRFLDTVISASPQETQREFVAALNALEGESLRQFTNSFKDLSPEKQDKVLSAASTGKSSNSALNPHTGTKVDMQSFAPTLGDYFENLKGWIIMAYYSSEIGMKELGWNGENFFESFPGCEHADSHS